MRISKEVFQVTLFLGRVFFTALAVLLVCLGCGGPEESITPTVADRELTVEAIDAEPLALLPGGMTGMLRVEVPAIVASGFGSTLIQVAERLAPLPPSTGFRVDRDLHRIVLGLYSIQGVDMAGVAIGRFDTGAIAAAASAPSSQPVMGALVQSTYAGRTVYTVNNLGFCVLTPRTALFGNETGMRRALDRIREGRAVRRLPSWATDLLEPSKAPLALGVDLRAQVVPDSFRKQLPFVQSLEAARILGNYQAPGLNLAGSLSYATPDQAAAGASQLLAMKNMVTQYEALLRLIGIAQPFQRLEARTQDHQVEFVAALDATILVRALGLALPLLGGTSAVTTTPVPAQLSPTNP